MISLKSIFITSGLVAVCFIALVSCQPQEAVPIPDASGCDECKSRYIRWLTSKNINATYWQNHQSSTTAADELCAEADDIYNNCFMTCIVDSFGNTIPHTEDRNAQALELFLRESCHNHACRLADTLACSRGAGRNSCLPESRECFLSMLTSGGCTPVLPCVAAERQAFMSTVRESLECFVSYPDLVADDVEETDERRLGLQVCKDVILSGCLADWSQDSSNQDFINFVTMDADFQNQICSGETVLATLDCMASAVNGTVSYSGVEYERPCDQLLMKDEAVEILQSSIRDLYLTYEFVCSANASDLCEKKDMLLGGPENLNDTSIEVPGPPPPAGDMDMTEHDHDDHDDHDHDDHDDQGDHDHHDDHDDHDHKDHNDHDDHDHKDHDGHDDHDDEKKQKLPGPVEKSSKGGSHNTGAVPKYWLGGLLMLLILALSL